MQLSHTKPIRQSYYHQKCTSKYTYLHQLHIKIIFYNQFEGNGIRNRVFNSGCVYIPLKQTINYIFHMYLIENEKKKKKETTK